MQGNTFIGLDVHKATISVAVAQGVRGGEVRHLGTVPHRPDQVRKLVEKLAAGGARLHFCYEAGPCGYGLHRQLTELGHDCMVVAPSRSPVYSNHGVHGLTPMKAGDRVKTDRRDATMLAKLHRAGELTAVWVPDAAHEAMRDLVRARATAVRVAGKARQHLQGPAGPSPPSFAPPEQRIASRPVPKSASPRPDLSRKEGLDEGLPAVADHGAVHASGAADRAAGVRRISKQSGGLFARRTSTPSPTPRPVSNG
jgi:hypothetical protein